MTWSIEGPGAALASFEEVVSLAESRGHTALAKGTRGTRIGLLVDVGRLNDALDEAGAAISALEAAGNAISLQFARVGLARARIETGASDSGRRLAETALADTRSSANRSLFVFVAPVVAQARSADGDLVGARTLLDEIASEQELQQRVDSILLLPSLCRSALRAEDVMLAERLHESIEPLYPPHEAAAVAARAHILEARREFGFAADAHRDAVGRLESNGMRLEQAYSALGLGRCLFALDDPSAEAEMREAQRLFAEMGARSRLEECDVLLARASRRSS